MRRSTLAFLDILLLLLLLRHDPAPAEASTAKPIADYVLTVQWDGPDLRQDDIDTYVLSPNGEMTWFRHRDVQGLVVLERDDQGAVNDKSPFNKELVTFHALPDGTYYLSIHGYRQQGAITTEQVKYEMVDSNGKVIFAGTVPMPLQRHETPLVTFTVQDGTIISSAPSTTLIVGRVLR